MACKENIIINKSYENLSNRNYLESWFVHGRHPRAKMLARKTSNMDLHWNGAHTGPKVVKTSMGADSKPGSQII
jgi:hypothetical protein